MTFLNKLTSPPLSPPEAGVTCGLAMLTVSGPVGDLERQLLSLLRDEFPPLSRITDVAFDDFATRGLALVSAPGTLTPTNLRQFIQQKLAEVITDPSDRLALYRYAYALAMANLNIDNGEQSFLDALKAEFALDPAACKATEIDVTTLYAPNYRALAAVTLGLIVVAADGKIQQSELINMKSARKVLDPIGRLDDTQFELVFKLGQSVYNRFLTDANNRRTFLYYMIVPRLDTADVRTQAFRYAASIATSDGDLATAEIDALKDMLAALGLTDDAGETLFNEYMGLVKTIDGQPAPQQPR